MAKAQLPSVVRLSAKAGSHAGDSIGRGHLQKIKSASTQQFDQCFSMSVYISFISFHYSRKSIKHLTKKRHLIVEKSALGVYHIINDIFDAQIIVTYELTPDDSLYLRCLTDDLTDKELTGRLADDYNAHKEQDIYVNYLEQITTANYEKEGDNNIMVCEGLFRLFGTSSEEIIARTKEETKAEEAAFYQPKIDALSSANIEQASIINALTSEIDNLKNLLTRHNIPYNSET